MELKEGILFDDRYLLVKHLGSGGFSEVWLVEDSKVANKRMALKIYAPGRGLDEDGIKLFSREFELVFDLSHTNLLRPSHFDVYNRSPYLTMPFCERGSTDKLIGNISETELWHFMNNVAAGLAYLHEQEPPIIHQDIKPANVMIDSNGKYLITDFGISTKVRSTLRKSVDNTKTSAGTLAYMGPERFGRENEPIKASDIWALGATLFEMIEGDAPFGNHGGLIQKSGAEIPYIKGNWSNELLEIINRCLLPDTWERPIASQIVEWTQEHFKGNKISFEKKVNYCCKCNKIIATGSKFCLHCGTAQNIETPKQKDEPAKSKSREKTEQHKNKTNDNEKQPKKDNVSKKEIKSQKSNKGKYVIAVVSFVAVVSMGLFLLKNYKKDESKTTVVSNIKIELDEGWYKYSGEVINGEPNGRGVATYSDGLKYEGDFLNGLRSGWGVAFYPDGSKYDGEFWENYQYGWGKMTFPDNSIYEGYYLWNEAHGQGEMRSASGERFVGEWKNNKPYNGNEYDADGNEVWIWNEGVRTIN